MIDAILENKRLNIPFAYLQLDSWWYYQVKFCEYYFFLKI